jgi:2-polyprenyl-6-methoxyphenol hydroxylase-like FAD-dependent oxidoreductase
MSTTDFTSTVPRRILICGAGIAGPALAYYLSRIPHGPEPLDITVLERSAVPRVTGQAVDLRGPGVGIMRDMGIEAEVRQHGTNEKGTSPSLRVVSS